MEYSMKIRPDFEPKNKKSLELFGMRFSHIKWSDNINLLFNIRKNRSGIVVEYKRHSFYFYWKLFKKI